MKKLFSLLLIIAMASALTTVVETNDGTAVLSSDTMTVKVNTAKNQMNINGILPLPMFPVVRSKGSVVKVSVPQETDTAAGEDTPVYTVSYPENFAADVFASVELEFNDDYVSQVVLVENSAEEAITVEIEINPISTGSYYVFAPYKKQPNANYLWISPDNSQEKAEGLVVAFDTDRPTFDLPQEINIKSNFIRVLSWNVLLSPGEQRAIGVKYRPGYINDETLLEINKYSTGFSKQYLLDTQSEPLFEITGSGASSSIKPAIGETITGTEVLALFKQTLDGFPDTATSESTLATLSVDLDDVVANRQSGLNSIEKVLLFRDMCREQGLPAEIRVGKKDTGYYAWAVAYAGTSSYTYDPIGKSSQYTRVYREPETATCKENIYECPWARGIITDEFCLGPICMSAPLLIVLFGLILIIVFTIFQYKTEIVYRLMGRQSGKKTVTEDTLEGSYIIVNEKYSPKDPLEAATWDAIRRRAGSFKTTTFVTETGFSPVLVKGIIEKFVEKGLIKKTE